MNKITKLYYQATCYWPRKFPTTEAEYLRFRDIMLGAYGLKDEPSTWATVAGQITATPGHKLRKPYGHIANVVKRLRINSLAQSYRTKAIKDLEALYAQKMSEEAEKMPKEGLPNESAQPGKDQDIQESSAPVV